MGFQPPSLTPLVPEAAKGGFKPVVPYWHSVSMRFRAALTPFSE